MVIRFRFRLYMLALVFVAGCAALLMKLWSLQIDQFEKYSRLIPGTSDVTVRIPGVRGEIKDRNGVTLVTNEPNFEVLFNLEDIVKAYRTDANGNKRDLPVFNYAVRINGIMRPRKETDIVKIVNESIIPGLEDLGLAIPYNSNTLRVHYRSFGGVVPWAYRSDLSFDEFATFAEHNLGLPGVALSVRAKRKYLFGAFASHILGYVKLPDIQRVSKEERKEFNYYVGDDFGVFGIEKSMDKQLRGRPGRRTLLRDEKGIIVGETNYEESKRGADVYLTLDARVQMIAERALREANIGRGAVAVLQPKTGDILALASVPSFDPNNFIPTIKAADWKRYQSDPTNPLVNRAIQPFAPGSTFKIPVGLAGCYAGIGNRHINCNGGQQYGSKFMKCWIYSKGGSHGSIGLDRALMVSCNDYFYNYGNQAGIEAIKTVGNLLGLGQKTGIPLDGEAAGRLPDPDWLRLQRGTSWTDALTALTAIGQGDNEATPLQMASVAATVATGGVRHQPWLVSRTVENDGETVGQARPRAIDLVKEGLKPDQIDLVRKGMWEVVNAPGGTARMARSEDFETAGKTGTAQFKRGGVSDNHAWFVCFAPFEEPEFAICTLVRGGKSGGGVAAPIAARILDEAMALQTGGEQTQLAMLDEALGNFEPVEAVSYEEPEEEVVAAVDGVTDGGEIPVGIAVSENEDDGGDGDTGEQVAARESAPVRAIPVEAPSVEPAADEAGSSAIPRATPVRKAIRFKPATATDD